MAGDLTWPGSAGDLTPSVKYYLRDIEARIPRWPRARREVLAELADGLRDATEYYLDRGMSREHAAARAVRDSGPAPVVADAVTEVLSAGQARLTAATLLVTGPVIGLLWLAALVPGRPPSDLLLQRPGIGALVIAAVLFEGLTVLATGSASGLPLPNMAPARTAAVACGATAICDVSLLAMTASILTNSSAHLGVFALLAGAASAVRFALTQRVAWRDLTVTCRR